jgi:lipopolysaccharide export system protein LptC
MVSAAKNLTIIFLFILVIGLSTWSILVTKKSNPSFSNTANQPDAFMEQVTATIFNKEGLPSLKIESPKMVHYTVDDTTHIEAPHITLYRESPQPWHIDSHYAKATRGVDQIFFWSHVVIHHLSDSANPATTLLTPTLMVFTDKKMAETQDEVTFVQPDTTMHGIGMLANLNTDTLQLLSQARGEYVPGAS